MASNAAPADLNLAVLELQAQEQLVTRESDDVPASDATYTFFIISRATGVSRRTKSNFAADQPSARVATARAGDAEGQCQAPLSWP